MKNDETVKLMAETIRGGLQKFVGQKNDHSTRVELKAHMAQVLEAFKYQADMSIVPSPEIKVEIEGSVAKFSFLDPKTKEPIDIATWMARASEGYYE